MNPSWVKRQSDKAEIYKEYMRNLQIETENMNKTANALKQIELTGSYVSPVQDTRTTTEKYVDIYRIKNELQSGLNELMSPDQSASVVNNLTEDEISFTRTQLPSIIADLKPRFALGVPAQVFINYVKKLLETFILTAGVKDAEKEKSAPAENIVSNLKETRKKAEEDRKQAEEDRKRAQVPPKKIRILKPTSTASTSTASTSTASTSTASNSTASSSTSTSPAGGSKAPAGGSKAPTPVSTPPSSSSSTTPKSSSPPPTTTSIKPRPADVYKEDKVAAIFAFENAQSPITLKTGTQTNLYALLAKGIDKESLPKNLNQYKKYLEEKPISRRDSSSASSSPSTTVESSSPSRLGLFGTSPVSQGKGIIRGKGLSKNRVIGKLEGSHEPKSVFSFAPLGRYVVNTNKLSKSILSINSKTGKSLPKLKSKTISKALANIIKEIIKGNEIANEMTSDLSDDEIDTLYHTLNECQLLSKLNNSPTSQTLSNTEKELNRFLILKGQILAGQNNAEVVREFKALLLKYMKKGQIPKSEGYDILEELLTLGY